MTTAGTTNHQAANMREVADVLDSLPDLPPLSVSFAATERFSIQVPGWLPISDAARMAAVDRLAAAFGLRAADVHWLEGAGRWHYSVARSEGLTADVFTSLSPSAGEPEQ